jgi:hypothetical protein
MKKPLRANRRPDLEFQSEQQRIDKLHSELEEMFRHAKERSDESSERVMASMGLLRSHHMFIRH